MTEILPQANDIFISVSRRGEKHRGYCVHEAQFTHDMFSTSANSLLPPAGPAYCLASGESCPRGRQQPANPERQRPPSRYQG